MLKVAAFIAVAAVLVGLLIVSQRPTGPMIVSGFVEADEIRVGSRVGGRVAKVFVEEGSPVSAGGLLAELEPFDLVERRAEAQHVLAQQNAVFDKVTAGFRAEEIAQAKALQAQAQADLDKLRHGPRLQEIAAAEADARLADAELELAKKVFVRVETLYGKQAADKNDLDEAGTKLKVAQAAVDSRTEQLTLLQEGSRSEDIARAVAKLDETEQVLKLRQNGSRTEDIGEAKARRDAAQATVLAIERQLEELKITAPFDAVVEAIDLRPGDLLSANAPAIALVDRSRMWIRAYVPENHLNLKTDHAVEIRIDSFPGRVFNGKVVFVARQAEFTPANVQTPEERSKQVFRIKVQLTDGLDVLRPGMAADVVLPKLSDLP